MKSIKKYLEQGKTVDNPVVAYHCRLWALQQAMNMRSKLPKEDMGFIMTLMDEVEKEKGGLDLDDASMQCENYAQDLFTKADDADRNGQSTLPTAKVFLAAAQIYEVCEQFGELPTDVVEKNKYAKWRFVEICKAAKERRAPAPPRGVAQSNGVQDKAAEERQPMGLPVTASESSSSGKRTLAEMAKICESQLGVSGSVMSVIHQAAEQLNVKAGDRPLKEIAEECMRVLGL